MSQLLDKLAETETYEELNWSPKQEGDLVAGTCNDVTVIETKFGDKMLIKIDTERVVENGQERPTGIYGVWERANIKRAATTWKLRTGDLVAFEYTGTNEKGAKTFKAVIERTEASEEYVKPEVKTSVQQDVEKVFHDDIPI